MIKVKRMLACGALLLSASFGAHAQQTTSTFAILTGIQDDGANISLTGVLVNTTTPTTLALPPPPDRCVNLFVTMLSNPEIYKLTVVTFTGINPVFGTVETSFTNCRLDRVLLIPRS